MKKRTNPFVGAVTRLALYFVLACSIAECAHAQFTKLHDFGNIPSGQTPRGQLAANGSQIFGTTFEGGLHSAGTIWSFDNSTGTFTNLHDFDETNGSFPSGGVTMSGAVLYGTTVTGGSDAGTVWSFNTHNQTFSNLHNFDTASDGGFPLASVAVSGTKVFGTALGGFPNGGGTLWSLDTVSGEYTKLHSFSATTDGNEPANILLVGDTTIIGSASDGGAYDDGTIWSYDLQTQVFSKLHDFNGLSDGATPVSSLAIAGSTIYGAALGGGADDHGTIWSYDMLSNSFATLHEFVGSLDGSSPLGGVMLDGDKLVGTTSKYDTVGGGTLWSFDLAANSFQRLHDFIFASDGYQPISSVVFAESQIFGTASFGGDADGGTIWSFAVPEPSGILMLISFLVLPVRQMIRSRRCEPRRWLLVSLLPLRERALSRLRRHAAARCVHAARTASSTPTLNSEPSS